MHNLQIAGCPCWAWFLVLMRTIVAACVQNSAEPMLLDSQGVELRPRSKSYTLRSDVRQSIGTPVEKAADSHLRFCIVQIQSLVLAFWFNAAFPTDACRWTPLRSDNVFCERCAILWLFAFAS